MTLQDPQPLLDGIDFAEYDQLRGYSANTNYADKHAVKYAESTPQRDGMSETDNHNFEEGSGPKIQSKQALPTSIQGLIQRFGDSVDTDSIAPTEICIEPTPEKLAHGAFKHSKPNFYALVQAGATVLVAQNAFGTGSSREQAPKALLAAGIQVVIAKSFAFIYGRNQANNGLLGIKLDDERFYELAQEGAELSVDIPERTITCGGEQFALQLDPVEESLLAAGGLMKMYNLYGSKLFQNLLDAASRGARGGADGVEKYTDGPRNNKLEW